MKPRLKWRAIANRGSARESVAPAESRQSARAATCTGRGATRDRCFSRCRHALPARHLAAIWCSRLPTRRSARFPVTRKSATCGRSSRAARRSNTPCGFNLDRRAYTRWNCITVVPGAISAIRKSRIDEAGGLSLETLAEDTDLTLTLHKRGQRIVYVPAAIAWTEAPETCAHAGATTFSLGLRHVAMSLETSRHGFQLELSRARLVQSAERLVFPNHSRRDHADGRFVSAGLASVWRMARGPAVRDHVSGMDVMLATLACILERESFCARGEFCRCD